jgi:hypothetical protein
MSTIPSAILLCGSTPYARRGALYQAWVDHYGKVGSPALVIVADTRSMNPTVPQRVIDAALAADEHAARSEYLAEWRRDVVAWLSGEQLEPVILSGIASLPPVSGRVYRGHMDAASGGGSDAMTGAVAYYDPEIDASVLAATIEIKPPFSPATACESLAALFREYGISRVMADRWGGEFVAEQMARFGVQVEPCAQNRSELYLSLAPLITAQRVRLLDDRKGLIAQCLGLVRKTGRLHDVVDHMPNQHDDLINSAAGALLAARANQFQAVDMSINAGFWKPSTWREARY